MYTMLFLVNEKSVFALRKLWFINFWNVGLYNANSVL
jgi:hypothetical protein